MEKKDSAFWKGQAELVHEIELIFGPFDPPAYLFLAEIGTDGSDWGGRIAAIKTAQESAPWRALHICCKFSYMYSYRYYK